jgi:uncharacterized damage-inducible protein DinB
MFNGEAFLLQAQYNQRMNQSLYRTCSRLTPEELNRDQGAFFGSINRTLNHILLVDTYWLHRLSKDKQQAALLDQQGRRIKITGVDQIVYAQFDELHAWRQRIDQHIVDYSEQLLHSDSDDQFLQPITHELQDGSKIRFPLVKALCHWFNHQTHHRGQITTLLSQQQVDYGVTDLLLMDLS